VRLSALDDVVCPGTAGKPCHGRLKVASDKAQAIAEDEIAEGILRCERCAAEYPVLCGVAILVADLAAYLRANYALILSLAMEHGLVIGKAMLDYLHRAGAHFAKRAEAGAPRAVSDYLCAHYDNVLDLLPPAHPLLPFLREYYERDIYTTVISMVAPHLATPGIVLDIGCSVGRMTHELATRSRAAYGLDLSFDSVFAARRVLLGLPTRLTRYELMRDESVRTERPLNVTIAPNAECVVASGTLLPFATASCDVVASANVVDVSGDPAGLVREKLRTLAPRGLFVLTDPYRWNVNASVMQWLGGLPSGVAMRMQLTRVLEILAEADDVPWVMRRYDREFLVYFNHCLVARKR